MIGETKLRDDPDDAANLRGAHAVVLGRQDSSGATDTCWGVEAYPRGTFSILDGAGS